MYVRQYLNEHVLRSFCGDMIHLDIHHMGMVSISNIRGTLGILSEFLWKAARAKDADLLEVCRSKSAPIHMALLSISAQMGRIA